MDVQHLKDLDSVRISLATQGRTYWAGLIERAVDAIRSHDARVTELLHANNREVDRRRAAERAITEQVRVVASSLEGDLMSDGTFRWHVSAPPTPQVCIQHKGPSDPGGAYIGLERGNKES